jgi:ABC-type dipeptide/oligopeptide/nickel transport system permease subunit
MVKEAAVRRTMAENAAPRGFRRRWYGALLRRPFAVMGLATLLAMAVVAALAPRLAPFDPPLTDDRDYFLSDRLAAAHSAPFWDRSGEAAFDQGEDPYDRSIPHDPVYTLGTDSDGRDMLSLLVYGLRFSLPVGLLAVALVALAGLALGLAAGWLGGAWDDLAMRAADAAEAVPALLAYVLAAAVASEPITGALASRGLALDAVPATALVLASAGWAPVARLVRAQVLALQQREWVLAARATGVPGRRILFRHVLPHTIGAVLVAASSQLPLMLVAEGLLGAIGIGARPSSDSLGEMIFHEFVYTVRAPVFVLMPTVLVIAMSVALTALSDGLRGALDPQRTG